MTNVEHIKPGYQWADPLQGKDLNLEVAGSDLRITGLFPTYGLEDSPCDLLRQYEKSPKQLAIGQQRTGTQSPEMVFANANTDDKLVAFVRKFGPVVANSVEDTGMIPDKELHEPRWPRRLIAHQDMEELRREQITYRAALELVQRLDHVNDRSVSVQQLMLAIDEKITDELTEAKVQHDYALVQQIMKIIAATFAQQPEQLSDSPLPVSSHWKAIVERVQEKFDNSHHASVHRLMEVIAASIKNYWDKSIYDYSAAQNLIRTIATNIQDWPNQWEREKSQRGVEPRWNLSGGSLKRIEELSKLRRDRFVADFVSGRIVICELLNSFPSTIYPSPIEMHSSIKYGIRPLLYSILRRQFINPRGFTFCAHTECRNFFNIERAGQQFCNSECSLHHRQRIYWQKQGKKLREKRSAKARKIRKHAAKPTSKKSAQKKTH